MDPVLVVGGGVAGIACARRVAHAGLPVTVYDRGRRIGGRMARRTVEGRAVDLGAAYFTVRDQGFTEVVKGWERRGLARPWTDTFHLGTADGLAGTRLGPIRWAAPDGLRSLVEDLAEGLDVRHPCDVAAVGPGATVDGLAASAVVLAMPDPQALDLLAESMAEERDALVRDWEPVLALAAGWGERCWPELDGVFVDESPVLTFLADDGRRRGDGAPVLVAHSTVVLAGLHLDQPDGAREVMLEEMRRVLGIDRPPEWAFVKRWSLAKPAASHDQAYLLTGGGIGVCGDGWGGRPRIEAAWCSGDALGRALVARLGPGPGG
ncbi:MAG TPA: FAD-dependent oxidoreductase [Jiangellales bacterium]|nr:FAD-dependent oxidoreductase [Jiangellales bacterium]